MTVWGGEVQHELVGINVFTDGYDTNTPSINVYVDYYVRTNNWPFSDNQTLSCWGSVSGTFNFNCSTGNGVVDLYVGRLIIYGQGQSYGGGPSYNFIAQISGQYLGGQPSCNIWWSLPPRPPNVPTNPGVGVDSVTSTSARVVVSASDPRGSAIDAYEVAVSLPGPDWGGWSQSWGGGTGTATNLQPASTYQAAAHAHNGIGWSGWTYSANFTTGATIPNAPTGLISSNVDQTTATESWTAPAYNGGSAITGYDLQLATDSNFSQNLQTFSYTASPANLTGLTPGIKYWARVRAKNAVGASAWSNVDSFTMLAGTPTINSPVDGSSVATAAPSVVLTALGIASDRTITVEISQDSTFASVYKTLTLNPGGASADNKYTLSDATMYLKSGQWYARAKVTNNTSGYVTPWSTTVGWTEAHVPSVSLVAPVSGKTYQYTPNVQLQFQFTDAAGSTDAQSAYQLVVENNNNGTSIFDSGKVASAAATVSVAIDASLKNTPLRWRVKVWDKGDTESAWTAYSVFTLSDLPVVTIITPPSGLAVDNGSPTFSWSVAIPSGGTQASAAVDVYDAASGSLVWHKDIAGSATSITPSTVILQNQKDYTFTVTATDTKGLSGSATQGFSTSYQAPEPIQYEIDASGQEDLGYVLVNWTDALPDDQFATWKVYRQAESDGVWELIATISDINTRTYRDYMLVAGETYIYSATQVATRSGTLLESPVGFYVDDQDNSNIENRKVDISIYSYWIINPDDPDLSVKLKTVIKDDSTLEFESQTYTIIGRGRHTDYGDELGYTGSLTIQVRDPERPSTFRAKVEAMRRANETYYLRTPFGRLFPVSLGNIGWSPLAGVGTYEMGDMTLPYEEVH